MHGEVAKSFLHKRILPIETGDDLIGATGTDMTDIFPAPLSLCKLSGEAYACLPWGKD
jgi:hypothetical protein